MNIIPNFNTIGTNRVNAVRFPNTYSMQFADSIGGGGYLDLGATNSFDATNGLTMSCWFRAVGPIGPGINWLCSNGGTGSVSSQFNFGIASDGKWNNFHDGTSHWTGITGLDDANWHHLTQIINYTTGNVFYYKDGQMSAGIGLYGNTYTTAVLSEIGSSFNPLKGQVDEFAIFRGVQNANDLYNNGTPGDLTSLNPLAWYRMGDPSPNPPTIRDLGSGSNDATMTGMTLPASGIVENVPT
mgnify:CR=1 FL=1